MDSERIREQIRENAAEIVRLHSRIRETYLKRSASPEKYRKLSFLVIHSHHAFPPFSTENRTSAV
jgi:hypothetical protein